MVLGRLRRSVAWAVPGAADPAVTQPAPCRALPCIPAASRDPGTAMARAGVISRAGGVELMGG